LQLKIFFIEDVMSQNLPVEDNTDKQTPNHHSVIDAFTRVKDFKGTGFPLQEARLVEQHYPELKAELIEIVRTTALDFSHAVESENWLIKILALGLLAKNRETEVFADLVSILNQPDDLLEGFFGDLITEGLPEIIAGLFNGDLASLESIMSNPAKDEFVRGSILEALCCLYLDKAIERSVFTKLLSRLWEIVKDCDDFFHLALATNSVELNLHELFDQIQISANGILQEFDEIEADYLKDQINLSRNGQPIKYPLRRRTNFIADPILDLTKWACFSESAADADSEYLDLCPDYGEIHDDSGHGTFVRSSPKIGRNEPCPCGSGKKYKKCCLS
jgi:hypothetical protein